MCLPVSSLFNEDVPVAFNCLLKDIIIAALVEFSSYGLCNCKWSASCSVVAVLVLVM